MKPNARNANNLPDVESGPIRETLLNAALIKFGAKGFDGASTRAIAARIDAHQPQINYHFESKTALWTAAVNHLFALLDKEVIYAFAATLSNAETDRLVWMTRTHVKPLFEAISLAWRTLRDARVATPIGSEVYYYLLVGGASIPYVNAPEVRLLTGREPHSARWTSSPRGSTHHDPAVRSLTCRRLTAASAIIRPEVKQPRRATPELLKCCGAKGNRTPDLLDANESRYQLRHSP